MIRKTSAVTQQIAKINKLCTCTILDSKSRNAEPSPEASGLSLLRPVWFAMAARLPGSNRVKIRKKMKKKKEFETVSNHPDSNPYPNALGTEPSTFAVQMGGWMKYPSWLAAQPSLYCATTLPSHAVCALLAPVTHCKWSWTHQQLYNFSILQHAF